MNINISQESKIQYVYCDDDCIYIEESFSYNEYLKYKPLLSNTIIDNKPDIFQNFQDITFEISR